MVDCLPSECKALSLNSSTTKMMMMVTKRRMLFHVNVPKFYISMCSVHITCPYKVFETSWFIFPFYEMFICGEENILS
jgi:hypothetical protein